MYRFLFNLHGIHRRRLSALTKKIFFTRIFFTAVLLISSVPVFSAPPNTNTTNYVTDPVIVTATRFPNTVPTEPTNVTIINDTEISHSTANNVSQVLQMLGGVQVNDLFGISGSKSKIDLGGFGDNSSLNSLVLVNGRRLNDVDLSGANLAAIPLQSIKRIEIIHGNASVLYGDNASNGVINIITKTGFDNQQSSISLSEGSYDTTRLRGSIVNSKNNDAATLFLDYFDSTGYRRNSGFRNVNAQMDVSRQLTNGLLGVRFNSTAEHTQLPGALSEATYLTDPRSSEKLDNEFADETRHLIETYYSSDKWAGELSYREKQQSSLQFGNINATLRTVAFTPRISLANAHNHFIAGVDYYSSRLGVLSDFGTYGINTSYTTRDSAALYLSNLLTIDRHNSISFGLRREDVRVEINNIDLSASTSNKDTRSDGEYAGNINYSHRYNESVRTYVRLARGFRFPVLDEMWDYFGTINILKPQTSTQLELGGSLQLTRNTALQANLFHSRLHNEIAYDNSAYANINLKPTRHDGINLQLTRQLGKGSRILASYGYRKARFSEGPYAGNRIPLVASQNFSLSQQYETPAGNVFSIDTIYTGSRYFGNDDNNSGKQMPAFTRINLGYKLKLAQGYLKTTINNVTDVKTADLGYYRSYNLPASPYFYYPLPERSVFMELGFSL